MSDSSRISPDVFISYASEDRETIAKPLVELLTAVGIKVWFDQFDLKIGDSLTRKIDNGLANCRYGVVILSTSFFGKHYTNRELAGLAQREVDGEKIILPVWVGINERQVREFSPPLADRIAGFWDDGIVSVVSKLIEVIKPELIETLLKRKIIALSCLTTGKEVVDVVVGCHFSYSHYDDPNDEAEINLVGGFIQELRDLGDIWDEIDATDQMRASFRTADLIKELEVAGWTVYGVKMKGKKMVAGVVGEWEWCAIAVIRGIPESIVFMDDQIYIFRTG
ncbi:MAG: hypothetical protein A3J24_06145 [Deltaproteobacteria bacterium RIFCSPLOWO2_02_FULL_53_8]|nr:MAG: hypothetical protein A3J24_06145 [Deltaproteobacteria bacterium RIFCSPLOWO2_02_FULL_53_8]